MEDYDGYYEEQCYAAACEAEAEQAYQDFLEELINQKKFTLFATYVAIDWLKSEAYHKSGIDPISFIDKIRDRLESRVGKTNEF